MLAKGHYRFFPLVLKLPVLAAAPGFDSLAGATERNAGAFVRRTPG
jgi:hypothetical protein